MPPGETFDEKAVNEGIWMTATHLDAIEASLQSRSSLESSNQTLTESIGTLTREIADMKEKNDRKKEKIKELEGRIEELNSKPSGTGTPLETREDPKIKEKNEPSYSNSESPINKWADSKLRRKKTAVTP